MLRSASAFVTATYEKVRLIPQTERASPLGFLRRRLLFYHFVSCKLLIEAYRNGLAVGIEPLQGGESFRLTAIAMKGLSGK